MGCENMANKSSFDEIIMVLHGSDVIEDSLGTCVDKKIVLMRRKSAEEEARSIMSRKWGIWSISDLTRVIELVNCNGFGDANTRFSNLFLKNRSHIVKVGVERTREARLFLLDPECDLKDRVRDAQSSYGSSSQGLFSSLLYVMDPTIYAPRFKPIIHNLQQFNLVSGPNLKTTMADYGRYCKILKGLESKYSIPPPLTDYVRTTWMGVWERYR